MIRWRTATGIRAVVPGQPLHILNIKISRTPIFLTKHERMDTGNSPSYYIFFITLKDPPIHSTDLLVTESVNFAPLETKNQQSPAIPGAQNDDKRRKYGPQKERFEEVTILERYK